MDGFMGTCILDRLEKILIEMFENQKIEILKAYEKYVMTDITFSSFILCQKFLEENDSFSQEEKEIYDKITTYLNDLVNALSKEDYESIIKKVDKTRQELIDKMYMYTAYTDIFVLYQYALKRLKYSYLSEEELDIELAKIKRDTFLEGLSLYLNADKDKEVLSAKIRGIIEEIPIRMTRAKLCDRIKEVLSLYKGSDKKSLDEYIFMLSSRAALYDPNEMKYNDKEFADFHEKLKTINFKTLDENSYNKLVQEFEENEKKIIHITEMIADFQTLINSIYALAIIRKYGLNSSIFAERCRDIWKGIVEKQVNEEMLTYFEGKMESAIEEVKKADIKFEKIKEYDIKETIEGFEEFQNDYIYISELTSESLYMDLDREKDNHKIDDDYLKEETAKYILKLENKMKSLSKPVKNALISNLISNLPFDFKNGNEFFENIIETIFNCSNKSEKLAVLNIINDMILEDSKERKNY